MFEGGQAIPSGGTRFPADALLALIILRIPALKYSKIPLILYELRCSVALELRRGAVICGGILALMQLVEKGLTGDSSDCGLREVEAESRDVLRVFLLSLVPTISP